MPRLSIIDVSGLAAVMVFLLALFMIIDSGYRGHYRFPVDLASVSHCTFQPGAVKEDALLVYLTRDGRFFFNSQKVRLEEIPDLIRTAIQQGSEPKVYLGIDARTKYWDVKTLLDQIRRAKIENVVLLMDQTNKISL